MKDLTDLYNALSLLKTPDECERFFTDLCTPAELEAMHERWQVAKALSQSLSYREISAKLGISTTTVTRVARCMTYGTGGYGIVLKRLPSSHQEFKRKKANSTVEETI